ncbi:MAG: TonB-dependent receptor [Chitinophagaceae bacterium]
MNRLLRIAFTVLFASLGTALFAQGSFIGGKLKDEKGEPIINANVEASAGGIVQGRALTDFDGEYSIRGLNSGNYTVKFSYLGKEASYTGISVAGDQGVTVNGKIITSNTLVGVTKTVTRYVKPIIDPRNPGGITRHTATEIENTAGHNIADVAKLATSVVSSGGSLSLGGGRITGTKYIVDGVQLNPGQVGFTDQAPGSVEDIATFTSGIPAKYGDASGGLISITTKGATATTRGNIAYEHSFDGYNLNRLSGNLSGPLWTKKDSLGAKRPVIGYSITADGQYSADQSPVYYNTPYINAAKLAEIQANPLVVVSQNGIQRLDYATQSVHASDISYQKTHPNSNYYRGQVGGKLDFNLTDNVSVRVGGSYFQNNYTNYDRSMELFTPDNFSNTAAQTGRGYVRFTQKFGNKVNVKDAKDNQITNAYYTVQVDYSKDYTTTQDPDKKHNTFDYGYVGKFDEKYAPNYVSGLDEATGKVGILLSGYRGTDVIFTPSDKNPILANYTKDAYAFNPNIATQLDIQANKGLLNGDIPAKAYGLYRNVGDNPQGGNGWSKRNTDQVGISIDASFDVKHKRTTHSIEFGLYYQQRNTRNYSISGSKLWTLMRQFSNRVVNQEVDKNYATYIRDGVSHTRAEVLNGTFVPNPNDTILYDRKFDASAETAFDLHLRQKLLASGQISSMKDYINTDLYDPSFYNLSMFSADDLLNQGTAAVSYYGFDYTGKMLTGNVNFNDFWTKRDADGYLTRPIGAYRPNYIAGYISDYIQYKDFKITLGVRIERFDNSTKVLKDPYSLYAEKTAADVQLIDPKTGKSMDYPGIVNNNRSAFVVYTGNNKVATPDVIGYRNGDTWYDANGREVQDPKVLQTESGSDGLQPILQNPNSKMADSAFDPNQSFTDYTPQVNAMPRINFSFPLTDRSFFYAHYDILYQRPNVGSYATQTDYLFMEQNPSRIYGNSNLKPERAVDYTVGFQQQLNDNSGITLSGFYRERKDQIQVRPYLYAYPTTYYAYGNRDFSTYKGMSLAYDLRRTGHVSLSINYTLSFAEGTGSTATSSNGGDGNNVSGNSLLAQLVAAGLPNLRTQFPLNIDSRHNLNAQVDYSFRKGEGPTIGKSHVLENSGINFVFTASSGQPYTKYKNAQGLADGAANSPVIDGAVNASRLKAHYNLDLQIHKIIALTQRKMPDGSMVPGRYSLKITAYAQNVLNIKDVTSVYGYTGRPDDDGFLTSPQGLTQIPGLVDPQSFIDLYSVYEKNPYNIGAPRTVVVGLSLQF